jgi:hypothetical protein
VVDHVGGVGVWRSEQQLVADLAAEAVEDRLPGDSDIGADQSWSGRGAR